ncbi:MAG: hypothetical protein K2M49_06050 [Muribaculaceae bacterium]|nr:hypothetical protein [Muribaculaceae bacterium]
MKRLSFLILCILPLYCSAITLEPTQKQEALNAANQFCNLLTRYCNGERTLTTQINALCSGADCSAFDDVNLNKEVTLRNYLLAIQKAYPHKLQTSITAPSLNDCIIYVEPELSFSEQWGSSMNSLMISTPEFHLAVENISDYFIVFPVKQSYPTLNKSTQKYIVYSVATKKITAFIAGQGSYLSYLNGLMSYAKWDIAKAATNFEAAAQNDSANRSSLKERCNYLAMACYIITGNYTKALECADRLNDRFYSSSCHIGNAIATENCDSAISYAHTLESEIQVNKDISQYIKGYAYAQLGIFYAMPSSYTDYSKSIEFLRKAVSTKNPMAGYTMYLISTCLDEIPYSDMTFKEGLDALFESAELGYPPACLIAGVIFEDVIEKEEVAMEYFKKSAEAGNAVALARIGRLLAKKGSNNEARKYLQQALDDPNLETYIASVYEAMVTKHWPQSRDDIREVLNKLLSPAASSSNSYSNSNSSSSYNSGTSQNNSSQSHYSSSSNYNSSYSYSNSNYSSSQSSSYSHRRKFNAPKDNICSGFSFGYVQKQWIFEYDGEKEKVGFFDDKNYVPGIQLGLRITPQFGYGFAMHFGLYYEYYFSKSTHLYDEYGEYWLKLDEHSLYVPFHLKYDFNFSKWFQLSVYGGIGLDCGLSGEVSICDDEGSYDSESIYSPEFNQKRFNASYEYGAAMRINHVQFDFVMSRGFVNMSADDAYKVYQNKQFNINISLMF